METSTKNCRLDLIGLFVSSEPLAKKSFVFYASLRLKRNIFVYARKFTPLSLE